MSCTACRYSRAPATRASFGRSRAITWSALTSRCESGLSATNKLAVLVCRPPVNPTTLAIAGSRRTMFWMVVSLVRIDWKLVDWSACTIPISEPVSCCGKKPFGTITNR